MRTYSGDVARRSVAPASLVALSYIVFQFLPLARLLLLGSFFDLPRFLNSICLLLCHFLQTTFWWWRGHCGLLSFELGLTDSQYVDSALISIQRGSNVGRLGGEERVSFCLERQGFVESFLRDG